MKSLSLLLLFILPFTFPSIAQTIAQQREQITAGVQKIGEATVKSDFETVLAYTHPKIIAAGGGKDSLMSVVKKNFKQMQSQGIAIKSFTIGVPGDIEIIGRLHYSMVPQTMVLQVPGGTLSAKSSTLAVSEDSGQHWYFINPKNKDEATLWAVFPELRGKLIIPDYGQPVFTPAKIQ